MAVVDPVEHPSWLTALATWRRQLTSELAVLPETLAQLREGVENFRRVTQRLVDATVAIEQLTEIQTGAVNEIRQRIDDANRAVREQISAVPGSDRVAGALEDLSDALARVNPLWARVFPRD